MHDPDPDSLPDCELTEVYRFPVKAGTTIDVPLHALCGYSVSILDDRAFVVCKVPIVSYKDDNGDRFIETEKSFNRAKLVADNLNRANGY